MLIWSLSSLALAEGTATLGTTQALRAGTVLSVDILADSETITWSGTGSLTVSAPDGTPLPDLVSGGSLVASQTGAYAFTVGVDQTVGSSWDLAVPGADGGRVWSFSWRFNAGSFSASAATDASFYARVPGGPPGTTAVIELSLAGLAGYVYSIDANRIGVDGAGSLSTLESGNSVTPEFPLYLEPPEASTYSVVSPTVSNLEFEGGQGLSSVLDGSVVSCGVLTSGGAEATFSFDTDVTGTAHLRCDLDGDGTFGSAGTPDVSLAAAAEPGANTVGWDGRDRYGNAVGAGTYTCRIDVRTGEFHYVGADIETSYPGLRLYELTAAGQRSPLPMHWDDTLVQERAVSMPNGEVGRVSSPPEGVMPGAYGSPVTPNVDARSWGEFAGSGKGNQSYLDTSTWLRSTASTSLAVGLIDFTADGDGDGLSDHTESCVLGTDPGIADTDGDGVPDGEQYGGDTSSGFDGGLESHSGFAEALAARQVERTRFGRSPVGSDRAVGELASWLPAAGPGGSYPVDVSPLDLVAVTEATDVAAVDYLLDGRRRGALLLIETRGAHYSHTKAICDRAAGDVLSEVRASADGTHHLATLVDPQSGRRDHAGSWVAIETDGTWSLHATWLVEDLPPLIEGQRAVQIQAWSSVPGAESRLLEQVAERLGARWASGAPVTVPPTFRSVSSFGPELTVDGPDGWRVVGTAEDGSRFERAQGEPLPPFLEASVLLERGGNTVDRTWVSDGSWISEQPCSVRTDRPDGLALAGCGAGDQEVIRTLRPSRTLQGSLVVHAESPGEVCVESATTASFACADLEAGWNRTPLDRFEGDPAALQSADLLVFRAAAGPVEVAGLALSPLGEDAVQEQCGCSSGGTAPWFASLLLLGLRRRS